MRSLEFLSIDPWHTIMAIGNLLILYFILKRFLFKPINEIIAKREQEVGKIYTEAEELRNNAEQDKMVYEEKLKTAKSEADLMIKNATDRAKSKSEEMLTEATREVVNSKRKAELDIELAKRKAVNDMKDDITEMVIGLAQQVVEIELSVDIHESLIDSAIAELGGKV